MKSVSRNNRAGGTAGGVVKGTPSRPRNIQAGEKWVERLRPVRYSNCRRTDLAPWVPPVQLSREQLVVHAVAFCLGRPI